MKTHNLLLTVTASLTLGIGSSSAAVVAFEAAKPASTSDLDWPGSAPASQTSVTVNKWFTGDDGENLSLRMVLVPTNSATLMRIDGSGLATGWNPATNNVGTAAYRWGNGEDMSWTVTIRDRDNANADITASYKVLLSSLQTANQAAISDSATITLTNGLSDSNTVVAAAGLNTNKVTNFTDFDGRSMSLVMSNNPSPAGYFRGKTTTFTVTAIPEPSTALLGVFGGLFMLIRRRK